MGQEEEEEERGRTRGPPVGTATPCSCGRDQLAAVLLRLLWGVWSQQLPPPPPPCGTAQRRADLPANSATATVPSVFWRQHPSFLWGRPVPLGAH